MLKIDVRGVLVLMMLMMLSLLMMLCTMPC